MRVHSDVIGPTDVDDAATYAGAALVRADARGSRSRKQAVEFYLSGSGVWGGQYGSAQHKTATWDEWGIAIAHLYVLDPAAHFGKNSYQSAEHFHWMTGDRFKTLLREDQHLRHNWLSGEVSGRSAGGSYVVRSCKCGAVQRQLDRLTWDEFQAVSA